MFYNTAAFVVNLTTTPLWLISHCSYSEGLSSSWAVVFMSVIMHERVSLKIVPKEIFRWKKNMPMEVADVLDRAEKDGERMAPFTPPCWKCCHYMNMYVNWLTSVNSANSTLFIYHSILLDPVSHSRTSPLRLWSSLKWNPTGSFQISSRIFLKVSLEPHRAESLVSNWSLSGMSR